MGYEVCVVVEDVTFQGLLKTMGQPGKDSFQQGQAVICDPPYHTCWNAEISISAQGRLNMAGYE